MINLQQNEGGGSSVGSGDGSQQLKKGPWTAAEDAVLADYVRNHGEGNWNAVQKNTGLNRCGKSCRLRWANHLRPNLKKGSFSPEEERLIVELHSKVGNKWARMASQMPGRTDNEIKNYWNTRIKRRLRQGLPLYPPDVQPLYHNGQQSPSPSPSLPSTTASSFSFHTPPQISPHAMSPLSHLYATNNQFMHMPPLQSPHSPTPPPFYTPYNSHFTASATLQSPSQPTTPPPSYNLNAASPIASPNLVYPTLPLLNTSSTPASLSSINTTTTATSSNFLPRSPPSLQLPDRIKRFHHEDGESYGNFESSANVSSIGTSTSCSMSSSAMFSFSSLPKGSVLTPSVATTTTDALPYPMFPSFSVDPTSLNTTLASRVLRAHFDQGLAVSDPGLANQIKLEPPSSQILSQDHNFEMRFDTNGEENISDHNQQGLIVGANGIGILEDLLEETQMLASSSDSFSLHDCSRMQEEKHLFVMPKSEPGPSISADFASVANPKKEPAAEFECSHEDLSKVLKAIPTSMQVPGWYSDGGEGSNGQSSVVTDDNPGVELNSMDSFFQPYTVCDNAMAPKSCPWDNLPRIC